jgi:putative membrane protein
VGVYMNDVSARIKFWDRVAWVLSVVVLLLVGMMRRVKFEVGIDFHFLPPLYSGLNAVCAVFLVVALVKIKRGDVAGHRRAINVAVLCSAVFLLGYVLYHFTTEETKFAGTGALRTVYLCLLASHVVLAAVILPFILLAYVRGYFQEVTRHKRLVRWVWPLWFYVALTGPVCYLMLKVGAGS